MATYGEAGKLLSYARKLSNHGSNQGIQNRTIKDLISNLSSELGSGLFRSSSSPLSDSEESAFFDLYDYVKSNYEGD